MSVLAEALKLLRAGQPGVLATVVRCAGSTPQQPGARLLVREEGSLVGTLGGGCVEGEVWSEAMALLQEGGGATVKAFQLNEELAAQDGLVCGGTMYVLLEPLSQSDLAWVEAAEAAEQGGSGVAVATRLSPPPPGTRLLIGEDGSLSGSWGEAEMEALARSRGLDLIAARESRGEYVVEGESELFLAAFTAPPRLLIAGAGHVGLALGRLAPPLGFRLLVVDDRPEFASRERFPQAETVVAAPFAEAIASLPLTANDAIVVATRGHKQDHTALEAACLTPAGYLALVGSRRKAHLIFQALLSAGVPPERVGQVRCPAGLNLGARTPEEIALSILAEILMLRRGGDGRPLKVEPLPGAARR